MSTPQGVSRGFHRLAVFLAAICLVGGGLVSVFVALDAANHASTHHQQLVCAHIHVPPAGYMPDPSNPASFSKVQAPYSTDEDVGLPLSLKEVGCSTSDDTVTYAEARNPPSFNWLSAFASALLPGAPIALILAMAIYLLFRAIGWVIGGGSIEIE